MFCWIFSAATIVIAVSEKKSGKAATHFEVLALLLTTKWLFSCICFLKFMLPSHYLYRSVTVIQKKYFHGILLFAWMAYNLSFFIYY